MLEVIRCWGGVGCVLSVTLVDKLLAGPFVAAICCCCCCRCCLLQPLPDALRGEKWAFVQLPLGNLQDMLKPVNEVNRGQLLLFSGLGSFLCWLMLPYSGIGLNVR